MRVHRGNIGTGYKAADPREQVDQQAGRHRAKKDTKRWCLGRPGREHEPRWEVEERWHRGRRGYPAGREQRCANCRKRLASYSCDASIFFHPATKQVRRWAYRGHGWVELFFYGPGLPPATWLDNEPL